ncbi:cytochrome c [Magnetovibrio sp.]|uniref:c-type cytochrome n=1 Tax=Magnetovibrio sp. TaxID=2024836 RepID=UPI002F94F3AF
MAPDQAPKTQPAPELMDAQGLHPDAPRHGSPIKWMALVMVTLVVLTTISMWGKEKVSIKASVTIPPLSEAAQRGREVFAQSCQECHGVDGAGGTRTGPPLIHPMYRENLYPDYVLKKVLREGKREKNWRFGPMEPVKNITEQQIDDVTLFIRTVQNASGID